MKCVLPVDGIAFTVVSLRHFIANVMGEYHRRSSDITPDFFQQLATVSDPGVTVSSIEVSAGSGRGDNYTSMLYRVKAKGSTESGASWSRSFVYKCLPHSRVRREAFKSDALFQNEVVFYMKALPALLTFQAARGCNDFIEVPKVYLANHSVVVLEDLKESGFVMADRKKGLDVEHCHAVLRTLAKFHALSMAMKTLEPESFSSEVATAVTECLFRHENEEWYRNYYRSATRNAVATVRECLVSPEDTKRYVDKFETFVDESFFQRMVSLVQPREPVAVLCHGDFWTNNIMFNYNESGAIGKLCFLDFQLVRYGSPALDLANLLYCCTSREMRTRHLNHLMDTYCGTIKQSLTKLGCPHAGENIEDIIRDEFHRCGKFGLGLAIDMIPISTCDSEQAPDLYGSVADSAESDKPVWTKSEVCRRRMTDLVQELVDNGDL